MLYGKDTSSSSSVKIIVFIMHPFQPKTFLYHWSQAVCVFRFDITNLDSWFKMNPVSHCGAGQLNVKKWKVHKNIHYFKSCRSIWMSGHLAVIPIWRECSFFSQCLQWSEESQIDHWLVDIISTGSDDEVTCDETRYGVFIAAVTVLFLQKHRLVFLFTLQKNTIIVNVFLSTKLNDNHQEDTVDTFQFKDFALHSAFIVPLFSSFLHILYQGSGGNISLLPCIV